MRLRTAEAMVTILHSRHLNTSKHFCMTWGAPMASTAFHFLCPHMQTSAKCKLFWFCIVVLCVRHQYKMSARVAFFVPPTSCTALHQGACSASSTAFSSVICTHVWKKSASPHHTKHKKGAQCNQHCTIFLAIQATDANCQSEPTNYLPYHSTASINQSINQSVNQSGVCSTPLQEAGIEPTTEAV